MQKMCITPAELRKALKAIEQCEANGFNASLAELNQRIADFEVDATLRDKLDQKP